jgi:hypothetical protein
MIDFQKQKEKNENKKKVKLTYFTWIPLICGIGKPYCILRTI